MPRVLCKCNPPKPPNVLKCTVGERAGRYYYACPDCKFSQFLPLKTPQEAVVEPTVATGSPRMAIVNTVLSREQAPQVPSSSPFAVFQKKNHGVAPPQPATTSSPQNDSASETLAVTQKRKRLEDDDAPTTTKEPDEREKGAEQERDLSNNKVSDVNATTTVTSTPATLPSAKTSTLHIVKRNPLPLSSESTNGTVSAKPTSTGFVVDDDIDLFDPAMDAAIAAASQVPATPRAATTAPANPFSSFRTNEPASVLQRKPGMISLRNVFAKTSVPDFQTEAGLEPESFATTKTTTTATEPIGLKSTSSTSTLDSTYANSGATENEEPFTDITCGCGMPAITNVVKTSTSAYFGQRYYACPKRREDTTRCGLWRLHSSIVQTRASIDSGNAKWAELSEATKGTVPPKPPQPKARHIIFHESVYAGGRRKLGLEDKAITPIIQGYSPNEYVLRKQALLDKIVKATNLQGWEHVFADPYENVYWYTDFRLYRGDYDAEMVAVYAVINEKLDNHDVLLSEQDEASVRDKVWLPITGYSKGDTGPIIGRCTAAHMIMVQDPCDDRTVYCLDRKALWHFLADNVALNAKASNTGDALNNTCFNKDTGFTVPILDPTGSPMMFAVMDLCACVEAAKHPLFPHPFSV